MRDAHKDWRHRYLSPKARPAKSKIDGWGTIAIAPIKSGELVIVVGGVIVPASDRKKYLEEVGHVGLFVNENFFIGPKTRRGSIAQGQINHSCEPNVGFISELSLVAIKNIAPGEELVIDYSMYDGRLDPFACNCKSPNCRKVVKPDDWKNPELQKKYGQYFSPYLKAKFKTE